MASLSFDIYLSVLNNSYDRMYILARSVENDGHLMIDSPWVIEAPWQSRYGNTTLERAPRTSRRSPTCYKHTCAPKIGMYVDLGELGA